MDDKKFQIFYDTTARALWAYVFRMTGDRARTDDVLQDAYVKWIEHGREIPDAAQKSYLYRIATNLVYDLSRKRSHLSTEMIGDTIAARPVDSDAKMDLAKALGLLSEQNRALLWLAYVENYSHEEMAEILNVKASSVKVLLFRAKNRLAGIFEHWNSKEIL